MVKPIAKLAQHTRHGVWFWVLFVLGGVGLWALPALGANYVVNSTNDVNDGTCDATHCSLREAINAANATSADDTITFSFSVSGTIVLGSTLPNIVDKSTAGKLTIDGGGVITISGNNSVRVFLVDSGGDLTLQSLTVSNGSAAFGGGIYNDGTVNITNSTLSSNSAGARAGGGIYNAGAGSTVNITNSTLSSNSASAGGGIYNAGGGTVNITNSTLSGNSASAGGGIRNNDTLTLKNTIIANSTSGGDCVNSGTVSPSNNNLIEDSTNACGLTNGVNGNIIGSDPNLGSLTGSPAYFPLNPNSLAIDAGDNATCAAAPVNNTSQNGVTRPQGPNCDIGSYEAPYFTLTVNGAGNGNGTVTATGITCTITAGAASGDCTEAYADGTAVTLSASAASGSIFAGWSGNPDCSDGSVTMDVDKTCTATFNLVQHTLTVNIAGTGSGTVISSPAGITCPGDCSEDYDHGTTVTLTATPSTGSGFAGWTGCDSVNNNQCTVTMTAAKHVTAAFNLNQFTLTVTKIGTGSGTVTSSPAGIDCGLDCSEVYTFNTVVMLTATPNAGSTFAGWSGDPDCSDGSVTMNADKTCTATFNLAYTLGDVNDDGKINTLDARMAQQHADGVITLTGNQFLAADVDTDSDVDSADATAIAKKGIGLPTGIPGFAQLPPSPHPAPWQGEGLLLVLLPMLFLLLLRRSRKIALLLLSVGMLGALSGCVGFLGIAPPSGPAVYLTSVAMPNGATRFIELRVQELTAQGGLASLQGRITFPSGVAIQSLTGLSGFVVKAICGTVSEPCSSPNELRFSIVKSSAGGVSNGAILRIAVQASGGSGQVYTLSWSGSAQAPIVLGGNTNVEITSYSTGNGQVKVQ